jgi:hypothetical protein
MRSEGRVGSGRNTRRGLTQFNNRNDKRHKWIPACAGMTGRPHVNQTIPSRPQGMNTSPIVR